MEMGNAETWMNVRVVNKWLWAHEKRDLE